LACGKLRRLRIFALLGPTRNAKYVSWHYERYLYFVCACVNKYINRSMWEPRDELDRAALGFMSGFVIMASGLTVYFSLANYRL